MKTHFKGDLTVGPEEIDLLKKLKELEAMILEDRNKWKKMIDHFASENRLGTRKEEKEDE